MNELEQQNFTAIKAIMESRRKICFTYDYRTIVPSVKRKVVTPAFVAYSKYAGCIVLCAEVPAVQMQDVLFAAQCLNFSLSAISEITAGDGFEKYPERRPDQMHYEDVYFDPRLDIAAQ